MSAITKKYTRLACLFWLLTFMCVYAPLISYAVAAFVNAEVEQKATLGITLVVAAILTAINVIAKYHIRSTLWIVLLGIYYCMKEIMPLLLIIAIGTILDEFVFTPLYKSYKNKARINREIDKRV